MKSGGKFRWGDTMQLPCETAIKEYILLLQTLFDLEKSNKGYTLFILKRFTYVIISFS